MAKTCPYCKSQIDDKAMKCANCKEWVSARSLKHPVWFTLCIFAIIYLFTQYINYETDKNYKDLMKEVDHLDERLNFVKNFKITYQNKTQTNNHIIIVGEVKNSGTYAKRNIRVECTYYNKENYPVEHIPLVLTGNFLAGETRPFQITFGDLKKISSDYDHYKLILREAL